MPEKYIKLSDAEAVISRLCDKCGNDEMAFALNWAGKLLKDIPTAEQTGETAEEQTGAKITPYQKKPLSDSTLRGMTKGELVNVLRDYEHNYSVLYEQYQNSVAAAERMLKEAAT